MKNLNDMKRNVKAWEREHKPSKNPSPHESPKEEPAKDAPINQREQANQKVEENKKNIEARRKIGANKRKYNELRRKANYKEQKENIEAGKTPVGNKEEYKKPTKGHDLVEAAKPRHKLADYRQPAWNKGIKREMVPEGKYIKHQIDAQGRRNVNFANTPLPNDAKDADGAKRARRVNDDIQEQQAERAHMDRGMRGMGEQAKRRLNPDIKDLIVQGKKELDELTDKNLEDDDGRAMKEWAEDMKETLLKFGHDELAEQVPDPEDTEAMQKFVKLAYKRAGFHYPTPIPDLEVGEITRSDGVTQRVYHIPKSPKKDKLKIRPGFVQEDRERPHGHEGRDDNVTQRIWKKDEDFKIKNVINQGDWKFDPDQQITKVTKTKGNQGFEFGGVNPSALVTYEDGSRAFFKSEQEHEHFAIDPQQRMRNEYGVSKFFHQNFSDKFSFNIPRSNIISLNKIDNEELIDILGVEEGEVLRNEFINGYPIDIIHDKEFIDKVDEKGLIESVIFNYAIGNSDYHGGNALIDEEGKVNVIDTASSILSILDPEEEDIEFNLSDNTLLWNYLDNVYDGEIEVDDETVRGFLDEEDIQEYIKDSINTLLEMEPEEFARNLLQNTELSDEEYEKKAGIIKENLGVLKNFVLEEDEEEQEKWNEWWQTVREDRLAEYKEQQAKKDAIKEEKEGKFSDDEDLQAILERVAAGESAEEAMESPEEPANKEPEHNIAMPKPIKTSEYTMQDLFKENQARRAEGLEPLNSIEELAASKLPKPTEEAVISEDEEKGFQEWAEQNEPPKVKLGAIPEEEFQKLIDKGILAPKPEDENEESSSNFQEEPTEEPKKESDQSVVEAFENAKRTTKEAPRPISDKGKRSANTLFMEDADDEPHKIQGWKPNTK